MEPRQGGIAIRSGPSAKAPIVAANPTLWWGSQFNILEMCQTIEPDQCIYARHRLGWSAFRSLKNGVIATFLSPTALQPEQPGQIGQHRPDPPCSQQFCSNAPTGKCNSLASVMFWPLAGSL